MTFARSLALLAALSSMLLVPARAESVTVVGTNFGLSVLMPPDDQSSLVSVAVPGQAGTLLPGLIPGLRIGAGSGTHEGYADLAFSLISGDGSTLFNFTGTANYQLNFSPEASVSPYLTVGLGLVTVAFEDNGSATPTIGGGLGVRRVLSGGQAGVRFEGRVDHLFEDDDAILQGTAFSVKFGLDLFFQ